MFCVLFCCCLLLFSFFFSFVFVVVDLSGVPPGEMGELSKVRYACFFVFVFVMALYLYGHRRGVGFFS